MYEKTAKTLTLLLLPGLFALDACSASYTSISVNTVVTSTKPPGFAPTQPVTLTTIPATSMSSLEQITGGWNTFRSPEFGFSFQYPALFDEGFPSFQSICNISIEENTYNKLFLVVGDIMINAEKTDQDLTGYTNYFIENNRQGWNFKQTQIEVGGLPANSLEYQQKSPPRHGFVTIVVDENNAITIQDFENNFFYCDLRDDHHPSLWIYERILQSWKFDK